MRSPLVFRHAFVLLSALASVQCGSPPEGLWKQWTIDSNGSGADGVHTADFNGDGYVDIVSGWEQSGDVKLYLNPGQENIREEGAWSAIVLNGREHLWGIEDAAFADLDLDGDAESVISSIEGYTRSLKIHHSRGGSFLDPQTWQTITVAPEGIAGYMKARAGQIDGAGGADIVAGTKAMDGQNAAIYWFRSPEHPFAGDGQEWSKYFVGEIDAKATTLAIRDMDSDQVPDIVYSGRYGVGWFRNPGYAMLGGGAVNAVWEQIVISPIGSEFTFCDDTGDASQNLVNVTAQGSGMVGQWFRRLDDSGRRWAEYPITSDDQRPGMASGKKFALKGVACGFVDGDATIDIVMTVSGYGHGVIMMSPRTEISSGEPWRLVDISGQDGHVKYDNLALVDMDGDGDLDIATTEEGSFFSSGQGVLWFENPLRSVGENSAE